MIGQIIDYGHSDKRYVYIIDQAEQYGGGPGGYWVWLTLEEINKMIEKRSNRIEVD
jgi:hypothetical protein